MVSHQPCVERPQTAFLLQRVLYLTSAVSLSFHHCFEWWALSNALDVWLSASLFHSYFLVLGLLSWLETLMTWDYDFMSNAVKNYFRPAEGIFGADSPHTLFNLLCLRAHLFACMNMETHRLLFFGGGGMLMCMWGRCVNLCFMFEIS